MVNGQVLYDGNHNLTEYYESWHPHTQEDKNEVEDNQRYLDTNIYNFTENYDSWTPNLGETYEDIAQNEVGMFT